MNPTVNLTVAFVIIIVLLFLFCFYLWARIRWSDDDIIRRIACGNEPVRFSRWQLIRYTSNYFVRLGAGAFGTVYEGTLPNGLKVAVKRLHAGVDWRSEKEFIADVVGTIGRARHTNLVKLVGYYFEVDTDSDVGGVFVRALVWEYMERGALDAVLASRGRDATAGRPVPNLHSLAVGVARGVRYLHEECQPKIVHYGIKPSNVLVDGELTPKVADFGLAQLMRRGGDAHAATAVAMQPPALTYKLDVYSFGKLLLQMVGLSQSQGRNLDETSLDSLPRLAWTKHESGGDAIDPVVERVCKVAFWCVQPQPDARPPMDVVVKMLEGAMDISPPPNPFMDQWGS